jgi:hypothetical protein
MTPRELHKQIRSLKKEDSVIKEGLKKKLGDLKSQFIKDNNTVKVGDVVTDRSGSIKVSFIECDVEFYNIPSIIYGGVILKKDGTPRKSDARRTILQKSLITETVIKGRLIKLKIEKGIPIPQRRWRQKEGENTRVKWAFDQMEIGDSILLTENISIWKAQKAFSKQKQAGKIASDLRLAQRKIGNQYRIWLVKE